MGRRALPQSRRQLRPRRPDKVPRTQQPTSLCGAGAGGGGSTGHPPCWGASPLPTAPSSPPPLCALSRPGCGSIPGAGSVRAEERRDREGPNPERPRGSFRRRSPELARLLQGVPRDRDLWTRAKERSAGRRGDRGALGTGPLARRVRSARPAGMRGDAAGAQDEGAGRGVSTHFKRRVFPGRETEAQRWELAPPVSQPPDGPRSLVGTTGPNFPGSRSPSCDPSAPAGPPSPGTARTSRDWPQPPRPPRSAGRAPLIAPPGPGPRPPGPPAPRPRQPGAGYSPGRARSGPGVRAAAAHSRASRAAPAPLLRPRGESCRRPRAGAPRAPASRSLSGGRPGPPGGGRRVRNKVGPPRRAGRSLVTRGPCAPGPPAPPAAAASRAVPAELAQGRRPGSEPNGSRPSPPTPGPFRRRFPPRLPGAERRLRGARWAGRAAQRKPEHNRAFLRPDPPPPARPSGRSVGAGPGPPRLAPPAPRTPPALGAPSPRRGRGPSRTEAPQVRAIVAA